MLLRVSIPVEAGNAAAKDGTLGPTIERILADLKPEAAYFFADDSDQRSSSIMLVGNPEVAPKRSRVSGWNRNDKSASGRPTSGQRVIPSGIPVFENLK